MVLSKFLPIIINWLKTSIREQAKKMFVLKIAPKKYRILNGNMRDFSVSLNLQYLPNIPGLYIFTLFSIYYFPLGIGALENIHDMSGNPMAIANFISKR